MESFYDKHGREITIDIDDLDVVALHEGIRIGELCFAEIDCDNGCSFIKLTNMKVAEEYQKAGIATEMMRVAVDFHGEFSRPLLSALGGSKVAAEDYYTQEGAALISRCISLGIVPPDSDEKPDINEWEV